MTPTVGDVCPITYYVHLYVNTNNSRTGVTMNVHSNCNYDHRFGVQSGSLDRRPRGW